MYKQRGDTRSKHHVRKNTLIQDINNGGLNMPDVESLIKAIKLSWIKRLLQDKNYTYMAQSVSQSTTSRLFSHIISIMS